MATKKKKNYVFFFEMLFERLCKKDYDKIDASFENDPLVFF